jgi:hypothetical protein
MAENSLALGIRPMAAPDYAASTMNRVNMMGALAKMDEYKAGVAEKNAVAQFMARPEFDASTPASQNALMAAAPTTGAGILKSMTEARAAGVDLKGKEFELQSKKIDTALKDITAYTTADATLAGIQKHLALGDIDQAKADGLIKSLQAAPSFEAWQMGTVRGLLDYKDRLAQTFTTQNLGGTTRQLATPTYGGGPAAVVPGSEAQTTMTPGDVRRAADAGLGRAVTLRGQDLQNDPNVVARVVTAADGTVTQLNKFGDVIGTPQRVGKPSATFEKTGAQRKQLEQDLTFAISELEKATKPGGPIETATGSGAGAARDKVYGFFGGATEGAVAIGKLKPVYDIILKMVPRFEGPQSEKDVVSYQDAAGNLANSNTPTATKMAAAKEILRLMKARKGQFLTRDMAEGSGIVADGVDTSNSLLQDTQ